LLNLVLVAQNQAVDLVPGHLAALLVNLLLDQAVVQLVQKAVKDLNQAAIQAAVVQKDLAVVHILQVTLIELLIHQTIRARNIIVAITLRRITMAPLGLHFGHSFGEAADIFSVHFILDQP
jgi:hypothetical protein